MNRPAMVGLAATLLVLAASVLWIAYSYRGNVTGVFLFGENFGVPPEVEVAFPDRIVLPRSNGYDGQFYFLVALDPFRPNRYAASFGPDNIKYRFGRIVWPAAAFVTSLGRVNWVPWSLIAWNAIFWGIAVGAAARIVRSSGRYPAWALLLCGGAGVQIATARMMNDAATAAFLALAIAAHLKRSERGEARQFWAAAAWLALATLAREASAVFVIALAADAILARRRLRALGVLAIGLAPTILWHSVVRVNAGEIHSAATGMNERLTLNFTIPLSGFIGGALPVVEGWIETPLSPGKVLALAHRFTYLIAAVLALEIGWRRRDFTSICAVGLAILVFITSREVWVEFWAYGHVFFLLVALVAFEFLRSGKRRYLWPLFYDIGFTLLFIGRELLRARGGAP